MHTETPDIRKKSRYRRYLITVLVVGAVSLYFHVLRFNGLHNSAALYIGLPLLIVLAIGRSNGSSSAVGRGCEVLTIALLLSMPIFMEGFICILMASPILYSLVIIGGVVVDKELKKTSTTRKFRLSFFSVGLALLAMEGVNENLSLNRYNEVSHSSIVHANIDSVRQKLSSTPDFSHGKPMFLRIFPSPISAEGKGLKVGDERKITFLYKKWGFSNEHIGSTVFRVVSASDTHFRFEIPHDDSYISHYLTWKKSSVSLKRLSADSTQVTWTLGFSRDLDPAWYFGPMQRYAARLAAGSLIDNLATP